MKRLHVLFVLLAFLMCTLDILFADEIAEGKLYSVIELAFEGPLQTPKDTPARDIDFWVEFQHESGSPVHRIYGFWDGDGRGHATGNVFKVRFCPTETGKWILSEVHSNAASLDNQHQGDHITVGQSDHPGFWMADPASTGKRWYRRSDGSHLYIIGNTHYSFLSGYMKGGMPSGNTIDGDIRGNADFFKKLRFGLSGDYYLNPVEKPYFDDEGQPTDWGDYAHRPNPQWFHNRVDLAVQTAYEVDLITDIILAGPDNEWARSTLRAKYNGGDPTPFLKYIAARYGSYPNVWICLCNEYEIREPVYSEKEIAEFGRIILNYLPYQTPLSVHATPNTLWADAFEDLPPWNDHIIIQKKLRHLSPAADVIQNVWENQNHPLYKPVINDELSYEGDGDSHNEGDSIESHLGAFLGGGYGTTGEKSASKEGQYFKGNFNADEHTAADNLKYLREVIDQHITFWKMAPGRDIFSNLAEGFRGMAWPGHEYVLGTNEAHQGLTAQLPSGSWKVTRYDMINKVETTLSENAVGRFVFDSPGSRAVLFHFKYNQ